MLAKVAHAIFKVLKVLKVLKDLKDLKILKDLKDLKILKSKKKRKPALCSLSIRPATMSGIFDKTGINGEADTSCSLS